MSYQFEDDVQKMEINLKDICSSLKILATPKDFQVEFFCKAVEGISGFLLVCMKNDDGMLCSTNILSNF